jgi:flagellar basal body rod protein FlgC
MPPDADNLSQIRDTGFPEPEECAGMLPAMDATRIAASGLQAASQRFSAAASNVVAGTSLGPAAPAASDPLTDMVTVREAAIDFRANLTVLKVSQQMTGRLLDMFT